VKKKIIIEIRVKIKNYTFQIVKILLIIVEMLLDKKRCGVRWFIIPREKRWWDRSNNDLKCEERIKTTHVKYVCRVKFEF
jgi:hypothetical protein